MGRIKTQLVKRTALELFRDNPDEFKKDFAENKLLVNGMIEVHSKKLRNIIAGYLTRLVKMKEEKDKK